MPISDLDDFEVIATRTCENAKRIRAGIRLLKITNKKRAQVPKWKRQLIGTRGAQNRKKNAPPSTGSSV